MGTRKKILVIDDDQSVCESIARILKSRGYDVFTETRYPEGIKKAEEILPDLAFISLLMDTTNGLKVSKELHAIAALKKLAVIMLISYKGELDPKYTVTIGIVDVLVKPPVEKDLISKTYSAIGPGDTRDVEEILRQTTDIYDPRTVPEALSRGLEEDYQDESPLFKGQEETAQGEHLSFVPAISDEVPSVTPEQTEEADYYVPRLRPDDIESAADDGLSDAVVPEDEWSPSEKYNVTTEKDGPAGTVDEEISFEEAEKQGHKNKLLLAAAVVVMVIVAAVGTYLYMNSFLSGGKRTSVPASAKVVPEAKEKKKELSQSSVTPTTSKMRKEAASKEEPGGVRKQNEAAPGLNPERKTEKHPVAQNSSADTSKKGPGLYKKGAFSLQIGYFADQKNAESLASKMKKNGYMVFVRKEEKADKKISYRVLVGEFKTKNEAMVQSVAILRTEGISSMPYKE